MLQVFAFYKSQYFYMRLYLYDLIEEHTQEMKSYSAPVSQKLSINIKICIKINMYVVINYFIQDLLQIVISKN